MAICIDYDIYVRIVEYRTKTEVTCENQVWAPLNKLATLVSQRLAQMCKTLVTYKAATPLHKAQPWRLYYKTRYASDTSTNQRVTIMPTTFVTSDTHFGHANILKFEPINRPFRLIEEHDNELIKRWNAVVGPKDVVWHLGDVLFGVRSFDLLKQLNGTKHLLLGNHDHYPLARYQEHFKKIQSYHTVNGCILSHVPVHESQFYRFKCNIHGHTHSHQLGDPRYICVSVEQTNLAPIPLDSIFKNLFL